MPLILPPSLIPRIRRMGLSAALWAVPVLAQAQSAFGPRPGTAAPPPASGMVAWLLQKQAEFHLGLTKAISAVAQEPSALLTLLGLAFAYGVVHAIGPGHGKAVIAAYLVSSERAAKRGIALAFAAALVQAIIALGIVGVVALVLGGSGQQMDDLAHYIGLAGFALIIGMGLLIVWRKGRALMGQQPADCGPDCGHDHGSAPENTTPGQLAIIAIGAGIRPCSGAIILLVFALSKGLYLAGAASVAVMALGTAIGTSAFALLALKAKALSLHLIAGRGEIVTKLVLAAELLAGMALVALGLLLFTGAMATPS